MNYGARCADCGHEELTVRPNCECGCHPTAPQPPPDNPPSRYKGRCDVHGFRVCDECQYGETDAKLLAAAEARIAALEAQLAEAQERLAMVAWLPMETAPKDGSRVFLLTVEHTGLGPDGPITFPPTVHTGWWNPEGDAWVDECGSFDGDADHLAQTGSWSSSTGWFQPNEVSHWMPIAAILPNAATAEAVAQHTAEVERRGAARLQQRVAAWVRSRIGDEHMQPKERAMRLLEEACELAQAHGIAHESVVKQVAHVFGRPTGEPSQEAAGVAVCLLGWCAATENNMLDLAVREIERIEAKPISQIRGSVARKADADLVTCVDGAAELEGA